MTLFPYTTLFRSQQEEVLKQLGQLQGILENQALLDSVQDDAEWTLTTSGVFTVKSMYQGLKDEPYIGQDIHRIWKMKVPPRIKVFGWLTYYEKILTAENLQKRGWNLPSMCVLCRRQAETIKHLFSECVMSLEVYTTLTGKFRLPVRNWRMELQKEGAHHWIVQKKWDLKSKEILLLAMFICWRERCNRIFRDQSKNIQELVDEVQDQWSYAH